MALLQNKKPIAIESFISALFLLEALWLDDWIRIGLSDHKAAFAVYYGKCF